MLYLASQFAWFLVPAFGLGLVMGWLCQDGPKRQLGHPKLGYLAGALALAAAATWTQVLNGVAALWIESALLFVAAYLAGCVLGAILAAALKPHAAAEANALIEGASAQSAAGVIHAPAKPVVSAIEPVGESAPELPKVENEDSIPGRRPTGLVMARNEGPDDLKIIKGIGPQNEERLHALGIWHFEQVANWTPENVEWVGSYLAFPGRIEREDWIEQARMLAVGAGELAGAKPGDEALKASGA